MNENFRIRHSLAALLLLLPTGIAQEDGSQPSYEEFPLERELVIGRFAPQHVQPEELMEAIGGFFGKEIRVRLDSSAEVSPRFQGLAQRPRFRCVGDTLLIFDRPVNVDFLVEHLKAIDQAPEGSPAGQLPQVAGSNLFEYRPRYVSMEAMKLALKPFERVVSRRTVKTPDGGHQTITVVNQTFVREENLVLIHGAQDQLAELRAFLERFDVPTPQIEVEAFILRRVEAGGTRKELPPEVAAGLSSLLEGAPLTKGASALLRTSVRSNRTVSIHLQDQRSWDLSLHPAAFDPEAGALSLDECKLLRSDLNGPGAQLIFSTQTTLHAGQYTVVGGGSEEGVFLVLRFRRVDGSPR